MEKEYMNCEFSGQPRCPHQMHPFMLALLAGVRQNSSEPTKQLTDEVENNANSLCLKCQDFNPRHKD